MIFGSASLARLMGLSGFSSPGAVALVSCTEVSSSALGPSNVGCRGIIDPQDQPSSSQMDPLDVEAILLVG